MIKHFKNLGLAITLACALAANAQVSNPTYVGPAGKPTSFTNNGVLVGKGTANVTATAAGIAGQCLLSGGPSVAPAYGSCAAGANVASVFGQVGAIPDLTGDVLTSGSSATLLKNTGTAGTYGTVTTDSAGRVSAGTVVTPVINGGTGLASLASRGVLFGAGTSNVSLTAPGGVGTVLTGKGAGTDPVFQLPVIPGQISGYGLANNGGTLTQLDIAAGYAADNTGALTIRGTALSKAVTGCAGWVAGNGNCGHDSPTVVGAWYHAYVAVISGNTDYFFSTNLSLTGLPSSPPSGTTSARYIGSFKVDGAGVPISFVQIGQYNYYATPSADLSAGAATTATLFTITAPLGLQTVPIISQAITGTGGTVWSPASTATGKPTNSGPVVYTGAEFMTDVSSRLYYQAAAASTVTVLTLGYINPYVAAR